ncbi:hypothetical protein GCM10010215_50530 [Streptomyces virginiae]|uniref:Uncharacterized protein n=1 Tax=Streptomyces virginiae TaxID=1961 RepID=A0ABQ3NQ46_STRVG|nr:hypothetical protein GCM10010215_50530 [Streptomyces virginiae]GHI14883.1 hypothetical protein Scinn_43460 [Streptomyces virginiae]
MRLLLQAGHVRSPDAERFGDALADGLELPWGQTHGQGGEVVVGGAVAQALDQGEAGGRWAAAPSRVRLRSRPARSHTAVGAGDRRRGGGTAPGVDRIDVWPHRC